MLIVPCECGEQYYADESHAGSGIRCTKCSRVLLIGGSSPAPAKGISAPRYGPESSADASRPPAFTAISQPGRMGIWVSSGVVAAAALLTAFYFAAGGRPEAGKQLPARPQEIPARPFEAPSSAQPAAPGRGYTVPETPPRSLPLGATPLGGGITGGISNLQVQNGTQHDALVRLVRLLHREQKIRNFYVPAGEEFIATQVPPGEYVLRVAFGRDWDSASRRFNHAPSFAETQRFTPHERHWTTQTEDGYIKHAEASKMSITLHKVPFGNFQSHPITQEEFWR